MHTAEASQNIDLEKSKWKNTLIEKKEKQGEAIEQRKASVLPKKWGAPSQEIIVKIKV